MAGENLARLNAPLQRLKDAVQENIVRNFRVSVDTIVVPDPAEWSFEDMSWKLPSGMIKRIVDCDREELFHIIMWSFEKIRRLQPPDAVEKARNAEVPEAAIRVETLAQSLARQKLALELLK